MGIDAVGIGLPHLDQDVFDRDAKAIEDDAFDMDTFTGNACRREGLAEFYVKGLEPGRTGGKADVDVGPGGLGWGFLEVGERLGHLIALQLVFKQG
jgi:hypothetical protein